MNTTEKNIPKWKEVSYDLQNKIESGELVAGAFIPTELELQQQYGVSRITVRNAVLRLVNKGYIERTKGRGSIVVNNKLSEQPLKIVGFSSEMKEKGLLTTTSYANIELVPAKGLIANIMGLSEKAPVYKISRVRCINNIPIGFFETYIIIELKLPLDETKYYGSLYEYLEKDFGVHINGVHQTVTAMNADADLTKYLDVKKGEAVLNMNRAGYVDGRLVEYSICRYDSKKYEFMFEICDKVSL